MNDTPKRRGRPRHSPSHLTRRKGDGKPGRPRKTETQRLAEKALGIYRDHIVGEEDPAMALLPESFTQNTRLYSLRDRAIINRLFTAKRLGLSDTKACALAGISKWTIVEWQKAALDEIERRDRGLPADRTKDDCVIFYIAYTAASLAPLATALEVIHESVVNDRDKETARWVAERMAPEDYGPTRRVEINESGDIDITVNHRIELSPQRMQMLTAGKEVDIIDALDVMVEEETENDESSSELS